MKKKKKNERKKDKRKARHSMWEPHVRKTIRVERSSSFILMLEGRTRVPIKWLNCMRSIIVNCAFHLRKTIILLLLVKTPVISKEEEEDGVVVVVPFITTKNKLCWQQIVVNDTDTKKKGIKNRRLTVFNRSKFNTYKKSFFKFKV